jgi:hypothetical protein
MTSPVKAIANRVLSDHLQFQVIAIRNGITETSDWYSEAEAVTIQEEILELELFDVVGIKSALPTSAGLKTPATLEGYTVDKIDEALNESLSTGAIDKASNIILKYIRRKTGNKRIFATLGVEEYKNATSAGVGLRFYAPGKKIESWRFNWQTSSGADYHNLKSIDLWKGKQHGPDFHIAFEHPLSLVQVLPQFVDMLMNGVKKGSFMTYPEGISLKEGLETVEMELAEAADPSEAFDGVLTLLASPKFTKNKVWSVWKSMGTKIFDSLEMKYPDLIVKAGRGYEWHGTDDDIKAIAKAKDDILHGIGAVRGRVGGGSAKETYAHDPKLDELEAARERITYEKQLDDLENLIKLTISGASNALFVAGRGGIGKTFTVEKVLHEAGLTDGDGYFKNTGTASAAGMYTLLFKYQDQIILFDDSDDALKDQEARNMMKAATDTKAIRKLVWNKMGKNVIEPENYDGSHDEMIDEGKIPRYFEYTGKVIFISNLTLNKLDPDGALRTRAFLIDIDPTEEEIYDFMETIVDKIPLDGKLFLDKEQRKGVVELLRTGGSQQTANLRKLARALNMKAGALKSGVNVDGPELARMIATYA